MITPVDYRLYSQDTIFKKFFDFIDDLFVAVIDFYLVLLGTAFTALLWLSSGMGLVAGAINLFSSNPQYLSSLGLMLFCVLMIVSRISRIFFWTYLMLGFFWVALETLILLSIMGADFDHLGSVHKLTGIMAVIVAMTFLLPPALISAFIVRQLNRLCVARDLEKAETAQYVKSRRKLPR